MQVVLKINVRKKAFILVVGIIIAAGALFTAVYDVLYRYNSSNTINLNAATVDYTGQTSWSVQGTKNNGAETRTLSFDAGTYMVIFAGQSGAPEVTYDCGYGAGAVCIAFYKADGSSERPNSMTVNIGAGSVSGGGKTEVKTNFARPGGWTTEKELVAIASGGGAGALGGRPINQGTFAGVESTNWITHPWISYGDASGNGSDYGFLRVHQPHKTTMDFVTTMFNPLIPLAVVRVVVLVILMVVVEVDIKMAVALVEVEVVHHGAIRYLRVTWKGLQQHLKLDTGMLLRDGYMTTMMLVGMVLCIWRD